MARQELETTIKQLGLTIESEFVPFSQSRNAADKMPSLNWKVTLRRDRHIIITTDYMAGCAHAPSYKQGDNTVMRHERIVKECETGRGTYPATQIKPDAVDVIHSLTLDSDVLDAGGFEDWASNFGYDTDSRNAESIYRQCLQIALKMRAVLGDDGLTALREAGQDY